MQFDDTCLVQPSDLTEALAEQLRTKQQLDTAKKLVLEAEVRYWEAVEEVERAERRRRRVTPQEAIDYVKRWKEAVDKGLDRRCIK